MSNFKVNQAYEDSKRRRILMDGDTFAEMLFLQIYDPEMFKTKIELPVRYCVPRFSFESAMNKIKVSPRNQAYGVLEDLPLKHYEIFVPENDISMKDEESRFVNCALNFREKFPTMTMEVSSKRIWELYRIATIQGKSDFDLL